MFENYFSRNLKEDEEVIKIIRPALATYCLPFFLAIIFLLLPFFLLFLLVRWQPWGILVFFVLLIVGSFLFLRVIIVWGKHAFVLTSRRLIDFDQRGLFSKTVSETFYENIIDVSYIQRGIFSTFFRYGTIIVQTSGPKNNIELENVENPAELKEEINDLIIERKSSNINKQ